MTQFSDLGLAEPVLRALSHEGYATPTPIQAQAIPSLLEGKDLLGIAQTGTGKTAAFALPTLDRLSKSDKRTAPRHCRVLVLAPTRELAAQIGDSFRAYGRFTKTSVAVVVGGVAHGPQIKALAPGVDVLVATPGRLLDHIDAGKLSLAQVEVVVLDEADHMLDLGFLPPIRRIIKLLPKSRQNLFFSATMPTQIGQLAGDMLREPVKVSVTPVATTAERVEQSVYLIEASRKRALLAELLDNPAFVRTLVFTRTKRGADRVAKHLEANKISASAIHGNKSQNQRERALAAFKDGQVQVLVATDIAARGIDVDGVTHVVNYELPNVPESYVHRIGRTARGGAAGQAIAFCADDERSLLRDIERTTRQSIPVIDRRDPEAAALQEAENATLRGQREGQGAGGRRPARGGRGAAGGENAGRSRNGGNGNGGRGNNANARRSQGASAASTTAEGKAGQGRYKGGRKPANAAEGQRPVENSRNDAGQNDGASANAPARAGRKTGFTPRNRDGAPARGRNGARDSREGSDARGNAPRNNQRNERNDRRSADDGSQNRIASNVAFLGKAPAGNSGNGVGAGRTATADASRGNRNTRNSGQGRGARDASGQARVKNGNRSRHSA
ncbi:DEAD/DEAH box helicase [Thalassospira marina]|uniref:DEAD/DEAH box helicase n=1 Tax=Thalassospira marina TaxID=2048283 RepID=A0ABM6Q6K9_9PROT|nr:DEAD/DEAH box helicase [Thalassospira marina]AUG52158.1 DEAD/DEAH box helicase [Thalassospira marina]